MALHGPILMEAAKGNLLAPLVGAPALNVFVLSGKTLIAARAAF